MRGRTILLVEDDFQDARDTQHALLHAGARVAGPFGDSESTLRYIKVGEPSCAVLNMHVRDGNSFEVAAALLGKAVPVIFVCSGEVNEMPPGFSQVPALQKPVDFHALLKLVARLSKESLA